MEFVRPENTPEELYIGGQYDLDEILCFAKAHFGEHYGLGDFVVTPEYHQVRCFGHDQYDGSDYTCFLSITLRS